jgi:hypothetical protein
MTNFKFTLLWISLTSIAGALLLLVRAMSKLVVLSGGTWP